MKKYELIANNFISDFEAGKISANEQLPTEQVIMNTYQVSRVTVRKAMEHLKKLGLIDRTAGKGTFYIGKKRDTTAKKLNIALVFPHTVAELIKIIEGIDTVFEKEDINVNTYFSNESPDQDINLCDKAIGDGADGIIIFPNDGEKNANYFFSLVNENYPIVFLDRSPITNCNIIQSNNEYGMYKIADYLIKQGHKNIAYITALSIGVLQDRYRGFLSALKNNGIEFNQENLVVLEKPLISVSSNPQPTYLGVEKLMSLKNPPSAIVCANDIIALHTITKLRQMNNTNSRIAVTGFDNANYSSKNAYSITTIEQDFKAMGEQAAHLMLKIIRNNEDTLTAIKTSVKLIVRSSTENLQE